MSDTLNRLFHVKENGSSIRTELMAGFTTFMIMAYILAVNPSILGTTGMDAGAVFMATAISAAIGTLFMAFFANYPFAMAPGMGLNAFFAFSVCGAMGYSWQMALAAVFLEGFVFIILSVTPVREQLFNCIPHGLKMGISAGIGMFIAFCGMQSAKLVVDAPTLVSIYPFKASIMDGTFYSAGIGAVLCLIGVFAISVMIHKNVPGSILWGIFLTWILGIICQLAGIYVPNPEIGMYSVIPDFSKGLVIPSLAPTFMQMDFSQVWSIEFVTVIVSFMFVDLFDTLGTLIGVAAKADMLDADGKLPNIKGALLADSTGTVVGALLGTSTVSSFVESSVGIGLGGRTGLTAVVVAILFLLSIPFAPIFLTIPAFATAPALIVVGFMMATSLAKIDFSDIMNAFPAYITVTTMTFMYSISEGIAFGVISYVVINVFSGEFRKKNINWVMYVLALIFVLRYIFV